MDDTSTSFERLVLVSFALIYSCMCTIIPLYETLHDLSLSVTSEESLRDSEPPDIFLLCTRDRRLHDVCLLVLRYPVDCCWKISTLKDNLLFGEITELGSPKPFTEYLFKKNLFGKGSGRAWLEVITVYYTI